MPIEITCPHCNRHYAVPDEVAGRDVYCAFCQGIVAG